MESLHFPITAIGPPLWLSCGLAECDCFRREFQPLRQSVLAMRDKHRLERERLKQEQEERWKQEEQKRMARVPRGFSGIWHRITGTYQKVRARNERETTRCITRDRDEKQALITRQLQERRTIQEKVQVLKQEHREAMLNIRLDIGRYMEMQGKTPELTDTFNRKGGANRGASPGCTSPLFWARKLGIRFASFIEDPCGREGDCP